MVLVLIFIARSAPVLLLVMTLLNVLVARAVMVVVARSGGRGLDGFGGVAAGRLGGGGVTT